MANNSKPQGSPEIAQPLPTNVDAERYVLGAVLVDNNALLTATEILEPEDFFVAGHVLIFYAMSDMHRKQLPIELITLIETLHTQGELEAAGGSPYIAALADGMPKVANIEHYARIVRAKKQLRVLIHATHKIQQAAFSGEGSVEQILADAKSALSAVADVKSRSGPEPLKIIIRDNFAQLEKIMEGGPSLTGVSTGYKSLDQATGDLQPGELIILAARPSVGKSSFALNLAENICVKQELPGLFFSLEMSKQSLLLRLVCAHRQINLSKFRSGYVTGDDWRKATDGFMSLAKSPLWIDDSSALTVGIVAARAERLKQEIDLRVLVVDYLQLLSGSRRFGNRQEEVSEISRSLKALAKDLGMPVVALSQLTRSPDKEDREPQLSDLRESGAIEQDADAVMFLHRGAMFKKNVDQADRNVTDLLIRKQRNGPTASLPFVFLENFTRFEERAPDPELFA